MADRGYDPSPGDPGVKHVKLLPAVFSNGRISLVRQAGGAVEARWRYLTFETAGTVLIEDEAGIILPYTRPAGAVLPFSGVAIRDVFAHGIAGQPTATTSDLVLYGHA